MIRQTILCAAMGVAAVACASVPDREAVEAVGGARAAIEQASRADARLAEAPAMLSAQQKLDAAEDALENGNEVRAVRLAEESKADAAFAAASAREQKAQVAVEEIEEAIRTLRSEAARP